MINIELLKKKATETYVYEDIDGMNKGTKLNSETFAKLIVEKCLEIIQNERSKTSLQYSAEQRRQSLDNVTHTINQHFGLDDSVL